MDNGFFSFLGQDFNRFEFPADIIRVTSGHGGEALLIKGSDRNALLDCGMAYCGEDTVRNLKNTTDRVDYILLTHSHYDHIGGLPYIRDAFPDAVVCGSEKCATILEKPGARKLMYELGTAARDLYTPECREDVRTDGLHVDLVLHDGDRLELGAESITAYETKGHTDCSLTYYLEPVRLMFTSESTGILEGEDYVHTPILKSFSDAYASLEKCRSLKPEYVCLPHFGMLPKVYNEIYFDKFEEECKSKIDFVSTMMLEGISEEDMLDRYLEKYWTPAKLQEQPYEAFKINSGHILKALLREVEGEKYV